MRISDKTVVHNLGLCAFGDGANISNIDVKDGKIVRIRPVHYDEYYTKEDLNYWTLTGRDGSTFEPGMKSLMPPFSMAFKSRTYGKSRVPYPMKRVDFDPNGERNTQNRGKSKYVRISWQEATDLIASEIKRIQETYGNHSIVCQADGHGETKAIHAPHGCMTGLLELTGGYTLQARNPDSWEGWYWGAKHAWGMDPVGQNTHAPGIVQDIAQHSDAVLYWGCDLETTPWGWEGQQASRIAYWYDDIKIKHIDISPDCNYTNAVHSNLWIPVLPNTDAALQLGIAYVWMTEDSYDKEYIATHAVGFDWFEYYVLGHEDGIPKTPEWAEEKCGIPAYKIKALARYWASHNVSIAHCNGGSYIRSAFSHEPGRLEVYLLGMQAVGAPGRNQLKFIEWSLFGMEDSSPLPISEFLPNCHGCYNGAILGRHPESFIPKTYMHKAIRGESMTWFGHGTAGDNRPDQFLQFQYPLEGENPLKMIWSDNPAFTTSLNGGAEYQDALRSENLEFYVVQVPWFEDDAKFADVILPICSKLELTDFNTDTLGGQWNSVIYEKAAVEPQGEAMSDWEAVIEVAKSLEKLGGKYEGIASKYSGDKTVEEQVKEGYMVCGGSDDFLDFDKFEKQNYQVIPTKKDQDSEPVGMYGFYSDPEKTPLETPTGKIEYYSQSLASMWPDDKSRGPVAHWVDRGDGHDDRLDSERAEKYPFLVVSNHPRWRVHAEMDSVEWFREIPTCKTIGPDGYAYEPVWINPIDAKKMEINDKDIVKVMNEHGAVMGAARVTERIRPGVLYMDHGANVDTIVPGEGGLDRGGVINLICPTPTSSKNCTGEVTSGFLAGIEKVDVFALAKQYPEQFNKKNYTAAYGNDVQAYIVEEA